MTSDIIHGNCLEELEKIDLNSINPVFVSDPPFNVGYKYATYKDRMKEAQYYQMLASIFSAHPHVLIHYPEQLHRYSIEIGTMPSRVVSWVYNSNTAKQHRDIAFYNVSPDFKQYGQDYKNPKDKRIAKRVEEGKKARLYDWWEINQVKNVNKDKTDHPCQMPIEVMRRIVGVLPSGVTVIDPFLGSGTTALACKQLGVPFIGIEMDEKYVEIAKKRIQ